MEPHLHGHILDVYDDHRNTKHLGQQREFLSDIHNQLNSWSITTASTPHMQTHRPGEESWQSFWAVGDPIEKGQRMVDFLFMHKTRKTIFLPSWKEKKKMLLWDKIEKILGPHPNLLEFKCLFQEAEKPQVPPAFTKDVSTLWASSLSACKCLGRVCSGILGTLGLTQESSPNSNHLTISGDEKFIIFSDGAAMN